MGAFFCKHRPACPTGTARFACAQRTIVEAAMLKGVVSERDGQRLLTLYGVPRSPISKVFTGKPVKQHEDTLW